MNKLLVLAFIFFCSLTVSNGSFSNAASDLPTPTEERLRTMSVAEIANLLPKPNFQDAPLLASSAPRVTIYLRGGIYRGTGNQPGKVSCPFYIIILPASAAKTFGLWADHEFLQPAEFLRAVGKEKRRWNSDYANYSSSLQLLREARKRLGLLSDYMLRTAPRINITSEGLFAGTVSFPPPWILVVASKPPVLDLEMVMSISTYDISPIESHTTVNLRVPESDIF